jgi:hypothetical protein
LGWHLLRVQNACDNRPSDHSDTSCGKEGGFHSHVPFRSTQSSEGFSA